MRRKKPLIRPRRPIAVAARSHSGAGPHADKRRSKKAEQRSLQREVVLEIKGCLVSEDPFSTSYVECPECGYEQADMGNHVSCEECGYGPMPTN
jgi:hypothetical protein